MYIGVQWKNVSIWFKIYKEATPHSAGPGVAIIITVSKEELRTWEGGF